MNQKQKHTFAYSFPLYFGMHVFRCSGCGKMFVFKQVEEFETEENKTYFICDTFLFEEQEPYEIWFQKTLN